MAKYASKNIKYFNNPNGPTITTVERNVFCVDNLYFKDIDGSGKLSKRLETTCKSSCR